MPIIYDTPARKETGWYVAETAAALRLITGVPRECAVLLGSAAAFDQAVKFLVWDEVSVAAESGTTVIKATATTTGRWRSA